MSKKTLILYGALSLLSIVIGVIGLRLSIKDLKNSQSKVYTFSGKIISCNYAQYNKYASYYFQVFINEKQTTLEIPNVYLSKFKRDDFEKTYSVDNTYVFVVMQDDYEKYDLIPVVGIKNKDNILLDENHVFKANFSNALLGLVFSSLIFAVGLIVVAFLFFCAIKKGLN